jgi:hypothetical protein
MRLSDGERRVYARTLWPLYAIGGLCWWIDVVVRVVRSGLSLGLLLPALTAVLFTAAAVAGRRGNLPLRWHRRQS